MSFPPSFDHAWDITQPPDTQLANLLGQDIRNLKDDIMQRMSLLSGTLANRPTPEILNAIWGGTGFGLLYFSTDTSQIFQWSGSVWVDITANFSTQPIAPGGSSGFSKIVATINLTAQQANIGTTIIYTPSANGFYRLSSYVVETQAATTSSTLPFPNVNWTDADSGIVEGYGAAFFNGSNTINVVGLFGFFQNPLCFYAKSGTNISFSTNTYASSGATPMQFALRMRLEYMG